MDVISKAQVGTNLLVEQWRSSHGNVYAVVITGHQVLVELTCTLGVTSVCFVDEKYTLDVYTIVIFNLWNLVWINSLDVHYDNIADCIFFRGGERFLQFNTKFTLASTVDDIEVSHCEFCGCLSHQIKSVNNEEHTEVDSFAGIVVT